MYGGKTFSRIFHVPDKWREKGCCLKLFMRGCFERNGSAQNGSKRPCKWEAYLYLRGTVPYRTVPKSHVNAATDTKSKNIEITMVRLAYIPRVC